MGGTFGKSGSFVLDHSYDNIPLNRLDGDSLSHGSIVTLSTKGYPEEEEGPLSLYESKAEKKLRRRSLLVAYATMFVMSIGFSIVLTGVWPYMQTLNPDLGKEYVGWVVAANPFGQVLASPLLGIWGNKLGKIRVPCLVTVTFFVIGNAMYSLLPALDGLGKMASYYGMIISRFIVGVSSANVTLTRSYVAGATTLKERTIGISIIAASQALGFVVGPVIQAILTKLIPGEGDTGISWLQWNKYTACSWVAAALGLVNIIILTPCVFKEYNISAKEVALMKSDTKNLKLPSPDSIGIAGILFSNFLALFIFTLVETLAEPLVQDEYGWSDDTALVVVGIALAAGGIVSVGMFTISGILCKKYDERKILLTLGFPVLIVGCFLLLPWGHATMSKRCPLNETTTLEPSTITTPTSQPPGGDILDVKLLSVTNNYYYPLQATPDPLECSESGCPYDLQPWCETIPQLQLAQLAVGFFIIMIGYPICVSMGQAIFSKMLGPRPQGLWMGILTGVGGLSRILGPIFVANVYTFYGTYITFGTLTLAMAIALIELLITYKRIAPMKQPTTRNVNGHDGPAAKEKF